MKKLDKPWSKTQDELYQFSITFETGLTRREALEKAYWEHEKLKKQSIWRESRTGWPQSLQWHEKLHGKILFCKWLHRCALQNCIPIRKLENPIKEARPEEKLQEAIEVTHKATLERVAKEREKKKKKDAKDNEKKEKKDRAKKLEDPAALLDTTIGKKKVDLKQKHRF